MNTLRKLLGVVVLASVSLALSAQLKIGHINSQELLSMMPETDSAQKKIEKIYKEHELMLEELSVEFNKKYDDFLKKLDDQANPMTPFMRSQKEGELQEIQQRIQTFQQNAEQDLQQQRAVLFQPIQEKAVKAINDVAAENNYTYIIDSAVGVLIYTAPGADDILPLVKNKLGLK
ncbi:MAG: OmpH family outer membrane protein [Bacteroidales bacterium]|nr:OmpH family outer membrane protein [Bacteroidales bacterium]